jgi:SiaC family regulatory phosphoprotein
MTPIRIARTEVTPEILFSPTERTLSIEGECHPENPAAFFGPFLALLQQYLETAQPGSFMMNVRFAYINSASTKAMRQIFVMLHEATLRGCSVDINWEFDSDDDAIQELGQDLLYGIGVTTVVFNEVMIDI